LQLFETRRHATKTATRRGSRALIFTFPWGPGAGGQCDSITISPCSSISILFFGGGKKGATRRFFFLCGFTRGLLRGTVRGRVQREERRRTSLAGRGGHLSPLHLHQGGVQTPPRGDPPPPGGRFRPPPRADPPPPAKISDRGSFFYGPGPSVKWTFRARPPPEVIQPLQGGSRPPLS
jgi:hypothetical protein